MRIKQVKMCVCTHKQMINNIKPATKNPKQSIIIIMANLMNDL
jgi:hypothetical protein